MYKNKHRAFKKRDVIYFENEQYTILSIYLNIDKVMIERPINGIPMKRLVDIKNINY